MSRCSGLCLRRGPKCCDGRRCRAASYSWVTSADEESLPSPCGLLQEDGGPVSSDYYVRGSTQVVLPPSRSGELPGRAQAPSDPSGRPLCASARECRTCR